MTKKQLSTGYKKLFKVSKHSYYQDDKLKTIKRLLAPSAVMIIGVCFIISITSLSNHMGQKNYMTQQSDYSDTIDPKLQEMIKKQLQLSIDQTDALRGCGVVLDMNTGAIKSMVSINGKSISGKTEDNLIINSAWEPGSVMKPLLVAAAIDLGKVSPETTFFDNNETYIGGYRITNAIQHQPKIISTQDVISDSINTGAVNILRMMGDDSSTIDEKARKNYYKYLTQSYQFGQPTGIKDFNEASGLVFTPDHGNSPEVIYANMAIGQSISVTPLQFASAYAAVLNGGSYYRPYLYFEHQAKIHENIVKPETSEKMRRLLQNAFAQNTPASQRVGYEIGGKTGTAHAVAPTGYYYPDSRDNGTYIGYLSRGKNEYVMLIRIDEPKTNDFASAVARNTWTSIVTQMIDANGSFHGE